MSLFGKGWTLRYFWHKVMQVRGISVIAFPAKLHCSGTVGLPRPTVTTCHKDPSAHAVQSVEAGSAAGREVHGKLASNGADVTSQESYKLVREAVQARVFASFCEPLTSIIKFTGPAMAPLLNRKPATHEFLLTYRMDNPAESSVLTGDVVCFRHPLGGVDGDGLMVRRVTATGGDTLESPDSSHKLAPGAAPLLRTLESPDSSHKLAPGAAPCCTRVPSTGTAGDTLAAPDSSHRLVPGAAPTHCLPCCTRVP